MSKLKYVLPFVGFLLLVIFLAIGLRGDPRSIPTPLLNKNAPNFQLPQLDASLPNFGPAQMTGKIWLLNVWATWCVSCQQEHPVLTEYGAKLPPIVGLSYKEIRGDATLNAPDESAAELKMARERSVNWLKEKGNPYSQVLMDLDGRVGINYGVYGVPETYLIDKEGIIRMKHIGPITKEYIEAELLPKVAQLSQL